MIVSKLSASVLTDLLSIRFGDSSLEELLGRYVEVAKAGIPGIEEASVTLVRRDKLWTACYTGELALAADEMQYERGYGPCVDAAVSGQLMRVRDMREETRWPDYAAAVVKEGVLSSVSIPLPLQLDLTGALNAYSRSPGMTDETVEAVTEVASHIAVAISNAVTSTDSARLAADMQAAMASRAVIEQAKGAIMAQNRCTPEKAFEILRVASMGRNVKLRELAEDLVGRLQEPA
jgi:GAF domain-containing protein